MRVRWMVTQSKLGDYPSEKAKRSPGETVIRPPQKRAEIKQVTYKPKHRAEHPAVMGPERLEEMRRLKRSGIDYHRERMDP